MADALSRAMLAGLSSEHIRKMLSDGITMEEIADAAESARDSGEGEFLGEDGFRPSDFSDAGNAKKFIEVNRGRLLYTDSRGWLWWDGVRWVADDHKASALAVQMSDKMLEEAQDAYRQALHQQAEAKAAGDRAEMERATALAREEREYYNHANRTRSARYINNMLGLAKHFCIIDPAKLDGNPAELNTPIGIIDLTTGDRRESDAESLCTKVTACAPGSKGAEMWIDFLNTVTEGDSKLMGFLQMVAGMALFGRVYHEGLILAYGGGRNGKSTMFNALSAVLGDYAGTLDIAVLTTDRQNRGAALATLRGKRLIIAGELEEGKRLSVSTIKQICSTDPMTVEEKYKSPEVVLPSHSLILYTNHLPRVGSTDDGTWRRLTVVPFTATITRDIPNYGARLVEEAGPAILTWAIQGAVLFARNGYKLQIPDVVAELTEDYRAREDWLSNFLEECCTMEPGARAPAGELYQTYREWAERSGDYVRRSTEFMAAMEGRGFRKITPKGKKFWTGIKIDMAKKYGVYAV